MNRQIYLHKNDIHCTLTTYLYCNFWQLWAADKLNLDAYIQWQKGLFVQSYDDDKKYKEIPNAFDWYFEQPRIKRPFDRAACEIWTWEFENWGATIDITSYQFMAQPLKVIKDYYKANLHFNDETQLRGSYLVNKYGIDFANTIGITWRGSDIYLESANGYEGRRYTPIEYYFKWIDRAIDTMDYGKIVRIACTAEEKDILTPLFKRYGNRAFLIEEFIQVPKGHKHNPERHSQVSGYERGLQPVLMVWLFSKCAWLIKNRASTSAVASWLSDGEIVNINHTEVLGFPPHIDGVEYEGKIYSI